MVDVSNQRLDRTAEIVAAYVSNNAVPAADLPALLDAVFGAVGFILPTAAMEQPLSPAKLKPAVPINKSVHDDFIVCLENGRRLKSLKRHLSAYYGLSPEAYRTKWGLPGDYPMVAPAYASRRSALARQTGLGRRPEDRPAALATMTALQADPEPRSETKTSTRPARPASRLERSVPA